MEEEKASIMNLGNTGIKVVVHDTSNSRAGHGKTGSEPLWEKTSTDIALGRRNLDWGEKQ